MVNYPEELRKRAHDISNAHKTLAQLKSKRQTDNPEGRDDLYGYIRPEQTFEWKAAEYIEELEARLNKTPQLCDVSGEPSLNFDNIKVGGIINTSLGSAIVEDGPTIDLNT